MSQVKRMAMVIERMDLALGGAERSVNELVKSLQGQGLEVDLLVATGSDSVPHALVLCPDIHSRRVSLEIFEKALLEHLRSAHYDCIHSVLPLNFAHVYQPRGGSYAESQIRHIASFPSPWQRLIKRATAFTNRRRASLCQRERQLVQNPRGPHIAALSQYVALQFRQHYQCPDERLTVIRNGVIPPSIVLESPPEEATNSCTLLLAANNFRLKGLAPAIEALALARRQCDIRLQVAGSGTRHPYQSLASRLGVGTALTFLGLEENIGPALSQCDAAILPTFYDPASRFVLEALTCGKPVITTSFNGAVDHFQVPRHGLIVTSPRDIEALSQAMVQMASPVTRRAMRAAITEDNLRDTIHMDRAARELIELYSSLDLSKGPLSC